MKTICDRCESIGRFGVSADLMLDGAYFCRSCADFYKEDIQRKAADACRNSGYVWHQTDGYCGRCHQVWEALKKQDQHIPGGIYPAIETAYGRTVDHGFNIRIF